MSIIVGVSEAQRAALYVKSEKKKKKLESSLRSPSSHFLLLYGSNGRVIQHEDPCPYSCRVILYVPFTIIPGLRKAVGPQ